MIFQTTKDDKIQEKEFAVFGALTGNQYDRVILTGDEVNILSELPLSNLKEYINHLATRATIESLK